MTSIRFLSVLVVAVFALAACGDPSYTPCFTDAGNAHIDCGSPVKQESKGDKLSQSDAYMLFGQIYSQVFYLNNQISQGMSSYNYSSGSYSGVYYAWDGSKMTYSGSPSGMAGSVSIVGDGSYSDSSYYAADYQAAFSSYPLSVKGTTNISGTLTVAHDQNGSDSYTMRFYGTVSTTGGLEGEYYMDVTVSSSSGSYTVEGSIGGVDLATEGV